MADQFERVARPSNASEALEGPSPQGINRNRMTMYLSIGAALLSVASAATSFYRFKEGEQDLVKAGTTKTITESSKIEIDREVSKVEAKYADALKRLETQLLEKDSQLRVEQIRTERTAQSKNLGEAALAASQKNNEDFKYLLSDFVTRPALPMFRDAMMCNAARGEYCGMLSGPAVGRPLINVPNPDWQRFNTARGSSFPRPDPDSAAWASERSKPPTATPKADF